MRRVKNIILRERKEAPTLRVKAFQMLIYFFIFILIFTFLSRGVFSMTLPRVQYENPKSSMIAHEIKKEGRTEAVKESITVAAGDLLVESVEVENGDTVQQGDVLFTVHLTSLEKKILSTERELEKLYMQREADITNDGINASEKGKKIQRAQSDHSRTNRNQDELVAKAKTEMDQAKKLLDEFYQRNNNQKPADNTTVLSVLQAKLKDAEQAAEKAEEKLAAIRQQEQDEIQRRISIEEAALQNQPPAVSESDTSNNQETAANQNGMTESRKDEIRRAVEAEFAVQIEMTEADVTKTSNELQEAQTALSTYENEQAQRTQMSKEEQEESFKSAYEAKKDAYQNALKSKEENLINSGRTVEDASAPDREDSTQESRELDIQEKEQELDRLKEIQENGGRILSAKQGLVTQMTVKAGDTTNGGMVAVIADLSWGCTFSAMLSESEVKLIEEGIEAELKDLAENKDMGRFTVDKIQYTPDESGNYRVDVQIPQEQASVGRRLEMKILARTKRHGVTIPLSAIRDGGNNQKYVFVLRETDGFLGAQLRVERIDITIEDNNNSLAAISSFDIKNDDRVVTDTSKSIEDGDIVRLEAGS